MGESVPETTDSCQHPLAHPSVRFRDTHKRSGEENLAEAKRTKTSIPDDVLDNQRSTELEGDKGESISQTDIIGAEKTTADLQKPRINPVTHGPLFLHLPL